MQKKELQDVKTPVNVVLTSGQIQRIDAIADREMVSRSLVVRRIIADHFDGDNKRRIQML